MIDAREILSSLRLPDEDEVEIQRIGAEIVAAIRDPKFDGTPVPVTIPAGETEEQQKRSFRIACAIQRRFQAKGWIVHFESVKLPDFFGEIRPHHRLWLQIDASYAFRENASVKLSHSPPSLRALVEELGEFFGLAASTTSIPEQPVLSILLGTYNRIEFLKRAITSFRHSVRTLSYEIVVTDGGSTDGSRTWLVAQPDVVLIGARHLDGAVKAFNQAYALCRGQYIANLNDDCIVKENTLDDGVRYLIEHPQCGQVALGIQERGRSSIVNEIYPKTQFPTVSWSTYYANFGVVRRIVSDSIARIQGGFWNPIYRTYSADVEFSAWVHRLGYEVIPLPHLVVEDTPIEDDLRKKNMELAGAEAKRMRARWSAEALRPDGPEPRVSHQELARYHEEKGKIVLGQDPKIPPDDVTTYAELCGFPEPGEERRIRAIGQAIRALDPVENEFPKQAEPRPERVLYVHLETPEDPQAGLDHALRKLGSNGYQKIGWIGKKRLILEQEILRTADELKPTLVFLQLQAPDLVDPVILHHLRMIAPDAVIVTWNGDIALCNSPWTISEWMTPLGRACDLNLHSSMTHVYILRAAGVHNTGYLQIGLDPEQYHAPKEIVKNQYDISFLGSRYIENDPFCSSYRRKNGTPTHDALLRDDVVRRMRKNFQTRFGLFGRNWDTVSFCMANNNNIGPCDCPPIQTITLHEAHRILWQSKIGLSISLDNSLECYSSDRLLRILGCGTLALVKRFPNMSVLGLQDDVNCVIWDTPENAVDKTKDLLVRPENLVRIANAGVKLAQEHHTWDIRVRELSTYLDAIRTKARKKS